MGEAIITRRGGTGGDLQYATGTFTGTITKVSTSVGTKGCYMSATISGLAFKPKMVFLLSDDIYEPAAIYVREGNSVYSHSGIFDTNVEREAYTGTEFAFTDDGFVLNDYKLDIYYYDPEVYSTGDTVRHCDYCVYG